MESYRSFFTTATMGQGAGPAPSDRTPTATVGQGAGPAPQADQTVGPSTEGPGDVDRVELSPEGSVEAGPAVMPDTSSVSSSVIEEIVSEIKLTLVSLEVGVM